MDALRVFETLKNPTEELDQNTIGLSFEPSIMQIVKKHLILKTMRIYGLIL